MFSPNSSYCLHCVRIHTQKQIKYVHHFPDSCFPDIINREKAITLSPDLRDEPVCYYTNDASFSIGIYSCVLKYLDIVMEFYEYEKFISDFFFCN